MTTPGNTVSRNPVGPVWPPRASREPLFYLLAILIFLIAAIFTLWFCGSMSGGMAMPGGWTMSMMWMSMAGQTWLEASVIFMTMWLAMMVAMMLPSALPMLVIYRRALHFRKDSHAELATWLMAAGYFVVWLGFGAIAYGIGVAAASAAMRWPPVSRAVPVTVGMALLVSGIFQFTPWKMSCLRHCRDPLHVVASYLHGGPGGGWRMGLHHGAHCAICCWGLMVMQLVLGVMNLTVMIIVAVIIALEKLAPRAEVIVWLTGAAAVVAGLVFIVRSLPFA
jgi:predicted metal-binding membrane protein